MPSQVLLFSQFDSVTDPAAMIGATQDAMTQSATKLAHALDGINPLSNVQVSVLQSW